MSVTDLCMRGRLLQVSMAGLVTTFGRCFLLLLILCNRDTATLSLPIQAQDLQPAAPHPGGGDIWGNHPLETNLLSPTSSFPGNLHALTHMALIVQSVQEERRYFSSSGEENGLWANQQKKAHTNNIKKKRQGFFGIDNADFVLRTFELKNQKSTETPLTDTSDDAMVARVALIKAVRMRNRQRQRVRTRPGRPRLSSRPRMSVDISIEDLRQLMETQGR